VKIRFRLVDNETRTFYLCGARNEFDWRVSNNFIIIIQPLLTLPENSWSWSSVGHVLVTCRWLPLSS